MLVGIIVYCICFFIKYNVFVVVYFDLEIFCLLIIFKECLVYKFWFCGLKKNVLWNNENFVKKMKSNYIFFCYMKVLIMYD